MVKVLKQIVKLQISLVPNYTEKSSTNFNYLVLIKYVISVRRLTIEVSYDQCLQYFNNYSKKTLSNLS